MIFPPQAAIEHNGILPSGRRFSLLRGDGASAGDYGMIENDEHFCIVPPDASGRDVEGVI